MASDRPKYVHGDTYPDGRPRWRFRRPGQPGATLPGPYKSEAFWAAYAAAMQGATARPASGRMPRQGSFRAASVAYFSHSEAFRRLDPITQSGRKRVFESMWLEPIRPGAEHIFGDCPIVDLGEQHVVILRDRKASSSHAANHRLKALRQFFAWATKEKLVRASPLANVRDLPIEGDGYHTWTTEEFARFEALHPIGSKARLALAILTYTGLRVSDASRLGRQHVRDGWIMIALHKGRRRAPKRLAIPVLPELQAVIDASSCGDLAFLADAYGRPMSAKLLGASVRRWCDEAGLKNCSAHGVRKGAATLAAEHGATESQLMAIFGWSDSEMAALYTRAARQKVLAGESMHLLSGAQKANKTLPPDATRQAGGRNGPQK